MSEREASSVSWINVVPLNRRERLARWWQEDVRQGSTYSSKRQREQEFMSSIPVSSIEGIACDGLKRALENQRRDIEEGGQFVTFPRATPDGSQYFGSIGIPSRPLGVRFTEQGLVELSDEDH